MPDKAHYRALRAIRQQKARAFVAEARAAIGCARCGGKPVDWHSEEHLARPHQRIANMASRGVSVEGIRREMARCEVLCRRCHMAGDGRMEALLARNRARRGLVLVGPRPCTQCGVPAKPLRRGLCNKCREKARRDRER